MTIKAADAYAQACSDNESLPDVFKFLKSQANLSNRDVLDVLLVDQFQRWKRQQAIPVDHYLSRVSELDDINKVELLVEEFGYLDGRGIAPEPIEFARRYTSLDEAAFQELCEAVEIEPAQLQSSGSTAKSTASEETIPQSVGRYEFVRSIGKGSFGEVFLAKDPELQRSVAIKIPTAQRVQMGGGSKEFLDEARNVARLDHPNIVPVYDCGQTDDGVCFVVSKYIKGKELRAEIRKGIGAFEAAQIAATIARALHVAHRNGLVHRDVKPGNIILDAKRQPHLLDFGLALQEQDASDTDILVGTPAYMSPEQAAGGDHNVDGRSDIYSLGIVLYEMLTGRRPVKSTDADEVLKRVSIGEVRPPRQLDDSIDPELERICMRALARKLSERFSTAKDFADELEAFLADNDQPTISATGSSRSHRKLIKTSSESSKWLPWAASLAAMAILAYAGYDITNWSQTNQIETAKTTTSNHSDLPVVETRSPLRLAVLNVRNVAGQDELDWLGHALTELLTLELAKSADLDVVDQDSIGLVRSDLQLFHTDSLGASTLKQIQDRTGANLIATGSYAPAGAQLERTRFDIQIQDTTSGDVVSTLTEEVEAGDWEPFAQLAATQIRSDLKLGPLDLMKTGQMNLGVPSTEASAKHYYHGLADMRAFNWASAAEHLSQAASLDPKSAVIHDAAAKILARIGNDKQARQHSRQATQLAANLPNDQQWEIVARNHRLEGRPTQAVAVYRELYQKQQGSIRHGLALTDAMVSAGQGRQALKLLKDLADAVTHPSESARIAIASASAAQSVSEFGQQRKFASSAESLAKQISSPLLQADALLLEGIALHRIGDRQAIKKLKESFELFDQHDDKHGAASAIGAIAKTYVDTGDLDTADEKIDEAIELSKSIDNDRLQNRFLSQRGEVLIFRGKFDQAIELLQETKTKYEELGDQLNAAGIGLTLANVMARRGKSEEAHQLIRDARKTFQTVGNRQGEARSWGQEGAMHGRAGAPTKARPQFQRALELFQEVGDRRGEATCLGDLASTYSGQGDLETASKYLSQSLELHRQLASRRGPSTIMYNLGLLYIRTGRAQDALALLREAHEGFAQRGNTMNACFVQRKFGDLQMRFGELDDAEETLEQCLATAHSAGSKSVEASALASLADVMVFRGQTAQAIELHKQSREIRQELKQDGNVAANNLELARIAMRDKRFDDAKELLRQSKDVLTMNTQGWDWIYRAAEAQLTARQANNKPQTSTNLARETEINASDTLAELEEFLKSRESQDVSMELALNLEKARLLAALNDPRTIDALDQVITEAQSQNLQANQLEALVEKFEFQAQTNQVDRQALGRVQIKAKELGFDGLSLRLDELKDQ